MTTPDAHALGSFTVDLLALFSPSEQGLVVAPRGRERALAAARALPAALVDDAAADVLAAMVKMARIARGSGAADDALDVLGAVVFELHGQALGAALLAAVVPPKDLARITGAASASTKAPPPPSSIASPDDDLYARLLG